MTLLVGTVLPMGRSTAQAGEAADRRTRGLAALKEGDRARARHFLLRALALDPANLDLAGDLLTVSEGDADTQALWALHATLAAADRTGKFKAPRTWPGVDKTDLATAGKVLRARFKALKALAAATGRLKTPHDGSIVRYAESIARELWAGSPSLEAAFRPVFETAAKRCNPTPKPVVKALGALMKESASTGKWGDALEAARILRGLHQQERQQDDMPTAPTGEQLAVTRVIEKARAELRVRDEDVPGPQDLEEVPRDAREEWNRLHATWESPGVAFSANKRYRIETTCGWQTLHVAATDVEFHHDRLVRWYGVDPFKDRPGTIRLCPSYSDLEGEGQPFWWAPGFQRGDTTTILVNFTDSAGLGGVLVHELTHRFDGAVFQGLPSWLMEGRAVHTQVCTLSPRDEQLDERRVAFHRMWESSNKGYTTARKLGEFLRGNPDDYRDNYDTGYALWVFLNRFSDFSPAQEGKPLFRSRVQAYLDSFRADRKKDAVKRFQAFFVDGGEGRPKTMAEFVTPFAKFCREIGSARPPAWQQPWAEKNAAAFKARNRKHNRAIYDKSTSPRSRGRYDPVAYGEGLSYRAGLLLERRGKKKPARLAYAWALSVDEPVPEHLAGAAELDEVTGSKGHAWVRRLRAFRLDRARQNHPGMDVPPRLVSFQVPVRGCLGRLSELAKAATEAGRTRLGRAIRADHFAVSDAFLGDGGLPVGDEVVGDPPPDPEPLPPDCAPYVDVLGSGLEEERWSPLDSKIKGRWNQPEPFQLELGRSKKGRAQSGLLRDAGVRRVSVRTDTFHHGTYTLRTRVRFLSAHVDARLVLGLTRRDRGIQIAFSGGDWSFAVGDKEKARPLTGVRVSLSDLRQFDRHAGRTTTHVAFDTPREVFEIAVHVSGSYVRVEVDGRHALSLRRITGAPVEGGIGFGLLSGVAAFEDAEVRRHRVLGNDHACPCARHDAPLQIDGPSRFPWSDIVGRRVEGLPPSPVGTLLLWFTRRTSNESRSVGLVDAAAMNAQAFFDGQDLPMDVHVVVPHVPGNVKRADAPDVDEDPFPAAEDLELDSAHYHVHGGHSDLGAHLEDLVPQFAQRYARTQTKERSLEMAELELYDSPVWIVVDDRGVIRSTGPGNIMGWARELAHRLAGR